MSKPLPCSGGKLVAVISDTHGSIPSKAMAVLKKADLIIHAGDFDTAEVLKALYNIGSVIAVRGNMDGGPWTAKLQRTELVEVGDVRIYVVHNLDRLDIDPAAAGIDVVIHGHTHRPKIVKKKGILYVNPGSLGWPRSDFTATVALLCIEGASITSQILEI